MRRRRDIIQVIWTTARLQDDYYELSLEGVGACNGHIYVYCRLFVSGGATMLKVKTFFAESPFFDPWINLAFEEYLLSLLSRHDVILYLWQNEHTVVIGRNQNAWKECRTSLLEKEKGTLARRLSGGGAVYHDLGNLNFTFLASHLSYDFIRHIKVLVDAFRSIGIPASFSGRNDILVHGRKISGNAFYQGKLGRYHHGTILVDVDLEKMVRYLQPPAAKLKAKGIDSVKSRVANLKEFNESLSIDVIKKAIFTSFLKEYGGEGSPISLKDLALKDNVQKLYKKYSSQQWIYGNSPDFDVQLEHHFDWGHVDFGFHVKEGMISHCQLYSDAMDGDLIASIAPLLHEVPLNGQALAERLRNSFPHSIPQEAHDIAFWFEHNWTNMF
jgi:lipoate-protein ligase A